MIWHRPISLEELNNAGKNIVSLLGIRFTEWDESSLTAMMPVDERTHQPWGVLHGGASVVLAESIGSYASSFVVDPDKLRVVGQEINANHLRPVSSGFVTGVCKPVHLGRTSHVWDIRIYNEAKKLVCITRLTTAVIKL